MYVVVVCGTDDVTSLLGVDEAGQWADLSVLRHIEHMTGSRVHILARDAESWRTCFLLLGEKVCAAVIPCDTYPRPGGLVG